MSSTGSATRQLTLVDLGTLLFLGAVWGGAFLFVRIAAPEVGPMWTAEARLAIGGVVLAAIGGRRTLRVLRGRVIAFLVVGATFAAIPGMLISFASLTLPAGFAALLNAATPLFTALLGVLVLRQRLPRHAVVGLCAGVVAVLVLVGWSPLELGPGTLVAVVAGLGAPASYAVAGTYVRSRLHGVGRLELATGMVVGGAIVALPAAILSGPPGTPSPSGIAALIAVGTLSTALAWPAFLGVLSRTTPTAASTVTFIVPAFAIAWGALALGEPVGPNLIVGFALVLVSLVLVLGIDPRAPLTGVRGAVHAVRVAAAGAAA